MGVSAPTDSAHPIFARLWATAMERFEPRAISEKRTQLVEGLQGTVIEVGCGAGTTFSHYPLSVERVIAVEPEPYLREVATDAAALVPVAVEVHAGDAEHLPAASGTIDAVVCSLVLCSVPDQAAALAEIVRVLKPGGELRYYEHVAEPAGTLSRRVQQRLDRTGVWPKLGGGCHVSRDTGQAIRAAGFTVDQEFVQTLGPPLVVPVRRHLIGIAHV